jgi:tripartite ATP-independent transporter DctP family solute receptor
MKIDRFKQTHSSGTELTGPENHGRRHFVRTLAGGMLGAVAAPALLTHPANAAEFTIKLANNLPIQHPTNVRAREAVERIKKATDGLVAIQLFPNNQLGGDPDMLSQVRSGAIQMYIVPSAFPFSVIPDLGIHGLAFAFKDYDSVWKAIDGDLGNYERKLFKSIDLYAFQTEWDNGFRQITSRDKPVRSPEDLVGFKIRTPASPLITTIFEGLGASPTAVNIKETYAALQTKLVDGQENPLQIVDTFKFYEVQKYCSLTNHVWDGFITSANLKFWEKLPADIRSIIEENFNQAAKAQRADLAKQNEQLRINLERKGMTVFQPDQAAFREKLRKSGYYTQAKKNFNPEAFALLEKHVGGLG